jgi:hypothetical protein
MPRRSRVPQAISREAPVADDYLTDRTVGGRRLGHKLAQLAGRWALRAAFLNDGKLSTVSVCCGQDPLLGPS